MSTFYNPSMQQYYASQGYAPQPYGGNQQPAQSSYNPQGGMAQSPVYGSQSNSMVGSGQIDPYMLDTFGYGGYYQPYGNQMNGMQGQTPVPQQPYYQVPTEYIPQGTPGLDQGGQQQQQQAQYGKYIVDRDYNSGAPIWGYYDLSTGQDIASPPTSKISDLVNMASGNAGPRGFGFGQPDLMRAYPGMQYGAGFDPGFDGH